MNKKNKFSIVFVILHYSIIEETNNCIKSIKENIDTEDFHIVLVDNASPNNSGAFLQEKYEGDEDVTVILNKVNLGFAKGNNIGIDYARNKLNAKFVCCLNNDTLMIQKDFFKQIESEYEKSNAAVIGPCIVQKDNSIGYYPRTLQDEKHYIKVLSSYDKKYDIKSYIKDLLRGFPVIKNILLIRRKKRILNESDNVRNVVLHGCCLIFTPIFFTKLSGFNPKTFLYHEEQLLFLDLQKNSLQSVYNSNLKIQHLENVSTNFICKNQKTKKEFERKNCIESLKILIEELHNYNEEREKNGKINQ